jgi:hypothetical protein
VTGVTDVRVRGMRVRRAAAAAVLSLAVWVVVVPGVTSPVRAQYPDASPQPVITTGDPRSDGGGPGLVGSPVEIAVGVVMLGLITIAGTTLVIRLTRR